MTSDGTTSEILWRPPDDAWTASRIGVFAASHCPQAVGDYEALLAWSVEQPNDFWQAVWDEIGVAASTPPTAVFDDRGMPGSRWFEGATFNYAERMLFGNGMDDDDTATISVSQSRASATTSMGELRDQVRRVAHSLRRLGVSRGDRVAAYLPNVDETLVAFLATASIGAIWSSCAPEFGTRAVLDRWSQIEPVVLLVADGYRYGDKSIDVGEEIAAIRAGLPSVRTTVALRYLDGAAPVPDAMDWDELCVPSDAPLTFEAVPFDHPLYVLYSSGTTGMPKAIVHGHGGVLVEHWKQLALHLDLGPDDRLFWFSTTGWMMWNFLISGLLVGSSIVFFDGNPGHPDLDTLWSLIAETEATLAGVSAPFLMACRDAGIEPGATWDLSALRAMGSTGAPLPAAGARWIVEHVKQVPVASISGGTDVCSAFLGSAPVVPVLAGAISCRQLGWSIDAFDAQGNSVRGVDGELVLTRPAPSMPVGFWGDADGSRYHDAYFSVYPGVWRHGDWITIADDGSCVVSGRSDATLNRGGVRLGSADFYSIVETLSGVTDSLVVHIEDPEGGLGELLLFIVVADGTELDESLRGQIRSELREHLSPRHVPDQIVEMPAVPRTMSGKKLEIPVKRIISGVPQAKAASAGALANPESLDYYTTWARARA